MPVTMTRNVTSGKPRVTNSSGGTRVVHREFIGNLLSSDLFSVNRYSINPGLPLIFPWLSGIAKQFERYRFGYLRFEYVARFGTQNNGSVLFGVDYDAKDATPVSEQQLTSYQGTVEAVPYRNFSLTCRPASLGGLKFVRTSDTYTGDLSLYDGGFFIASTVSFDEIAKTCGKLWVSYDCHFQTPQTLSTQQIEPPPGAFTVYSNSLESGVEQGVFRRLLKTDAEPQLDQLGFGPVTADGINIPPGCYRISGSVQTEFTPNGASPGATFAELLVTDAKGGTASLLLSQEEIPASAGLAAPAWSRILDIVDQGVRILPRLIASDYDLALGTLRLIDFSIQRMARIAPA